MEENRYIKSSFDFLNSDDNWIKEKLMYDVISSLGWQGPLDADTAVSKDGLVSALRDSKVLKDSNKMKFTSQIFRVPYGPRRWDLDSLEYLNELLEKTYSVRIEADESGKEYRLQNTGLFVGDTDDDSESDGTTSFRQIRLELAHEKAKSILDAEGMTDTELERLRDKLW